MNQYLNSPFFWALISMFALVGACSVVGSKKIGSHPALGWIIVSIISLGRVILVLPFVEQPRFFLDGFNAIIGIPIFLTGVFWGLAPCFLIRPLNIAEKDMEGDTDLAIAKDEVKKLAAPYKDDIKTADAQSRYCVHLLREQGN